jgi:hypothetical protein
MPTINEINSQNPIEVSKGGTGTSSFTTDAVCCYDGTSIKSTSVGSAGSVLVSNDSSATPNFYKKSHILLHTVNASSSANVVFNSTYITNAYSMYLILINGYVLSSTSTTLAFQFSSDNGSHFIDTNYQSGLSSVTWNGTTWNNINASNLGYLSYPSGTAQFPGDVKLNLYNLSTSSYPYFYGNGWVNFNEQFLTCGYNTTTAGVNYIIIFPLDGNITRGTFSLYGVVT